MAEIAIPLIKKHCHFLRTDNNLFVAAKAFAAGVILAISFIHMLSDVSEALNHSCLPSYLWSKFPFIGFFAMMVTLFTLLLNFTWTQYYERKQGLKWASEEQIWVGSSEPGIIEWNGGKVFGEEESSGMHIVGMHAHMVHHKHNHPHGNDACHGIDGLKEQGHVHAHVDIEEGEEETNVRHVVVSQGLHLEVASRKPSLRPHRLQE
ncbi:hypothetical protein VNO77_44428 [Canavalia gladiata]|uniref:Uncharacterized protein n=1 Tax=Canavalia gladiata TaxID=3824 RepID=A0AAN9PNT2_CANGL